MAQEQSGAAFKYTYKKIITLLMCLFLVTVMLAGCGAVDTATEGVSEPPIVEATPVQADDLEPLAEVDVVSEEEARQQVELEEKQKQAIREAEVLRAQYDYEAALAKLSAPALAGGMIDEEIASIHAEMDTLVNYEDDIPHIFFHSLIVYPELIFKDKVTPMGGYNAGFAEKAELEKILPQLYERGYVLYDLNECWEMVDGKMTRKEILLPPGKTPLILSVDDVAYSYGKGYAQALTVNEAGSLIYLIKNPDGELIEMPDGDVMGVVDLFVAEHPDFAYQGHKGTIALTGYQGAFGYSYETEEGVAEIQKVAEALKADGWNFASHSYTHNSSNYYGPGCSAAKIEYDINKWVDVVTPCLGETRLFIAPFGYRVKQPALQYILDAGFNIYCTVKSSIENELYDDYALMTRIEISGYSMTYYKQLLNDKFFNVDEVFDAEGRPPVI